MGGFDPVSPFAHIKIAPPHQNINAQWKQRVQQHADKTYLYYAEKAWSYAEFDTLSDQAAGMLQALGAQKGNHIAVLIPNSVEFLFAWFGAMKGGFGGEGFGIVYLEAAAFGVPSLAYDCGGCTDFIRNGVNGVLVEPGNIGELARSIHHLATNPIALFELSKNAHETVMNEFTRPTIRKQVIDAFDSF